MSAPRIATSKWKPQVLAFAETAGVAEYLDPLLEATQAMFPAMRSLRVEIETDPEIVDDCHIVWEVAVPFTRAREHLASQKRWIAALCDLCPAPLTCVFRLMLVPLPNEPA